ncbi:MAG: hypothetical protein ACKOEO_15135 [Planctomycetaceae bacterium]
MPLAVHPAKLQNSAQKPHHHPKATAMTRATRKISKKASRKADNKATSRTRSEFNPQFRITNAITRDLTTIERARGFLQAATLSEQWVSSMSQRALLLEAHHTTHIEGTQLTLEQS